jgi:hypothetical protein
MYKWLGPSAELPKDFNFEAFLLIIQDHVPELTYTRERGNYARFHLASDHPADPNLRTKVIRAREAGTTIGREDVESLFQKFDLDLQKFRDGFNLFYSLQST